MKAANVIYPSFIAFTFLSATHVDLAAAVSPISVRFMSLTKDADIVSGPSAGIAVKTITRLGSGSFESTAFCKVVRGGKLSKCKIATISKDTKNARLATLDLAERVIVGLSQVSANRGDLKAKFALVIRADDGITAICIKSPCQSFFDGSPTPPPPSFATYQ